MLRHLPLFKVLAHERHFRRAGEVLGLSQSAISRRLLELETELGFALVKRSTRAVTLTPAGEHLLAQITPLLGELDGAVATARAISHGKRGHLAIGYTPASLSSYAAQAIKALRAEMPDIDISIHEMTTNAQHAALLSRSLHIALLHPPIDAEGLSVELLGHERMMLVVSRDHWLARRRRIALADFASECFLLYPREIGPTLYDAMIACCERAGFTPKLAQNCTSWPAAISLASNGVGVAWVPRGFQSSAGRGVRFLDLRGEAPSLPFALVQRSRRSPGFVDEARQIIARASQKHFVSRPRR